MESNAAERWIYAKLSTDATLITKVGTRTYNTRRPPESALPCVIWQLQSGDDVILLGAVRLWSNLRYLVRGIGETGSYGGDLQAIADRIDALLHGASGSNVDGTVWTCVRAAPFQMIETVAGREYRHLGGIYRIQAR